MIHFLSQTEVFVSPHKDEGESQEEIGQLQEVSKDTKKEDNESIGSPKGSPPSTSSTPPMTSQQALPPLCKYGAKCYRKNPIHFQEFRHPKCPDSS